MEITLTGADFSNTGLGNTKWVEKFIAKAGITDTAKLAALRALYVQYVSFGFKDKFEVFKLYVGGSKEIDSLNTINLDDDYGTDFFNDTDAKHTTNGWVTTPGASANYGKSRYKIKSLSKFHMHSELITRDAAGSNCAISNYLLSTGSLSYDYRGAGNVNIRFDVGVTGDGGKVVTVDTGTTSIRLASAVINGTSIKGYYAGTQIMSRTGTAAFGIPTGTETLYEGTLGLGYETSRVYNGKCLFIGYGATEWTATDEANLNTMMLTYRTSLGI